MAEPRMKSSWEIALERAEKLGKPSEEEIKKRREETCVPIGQALSRKYLSGLPVRDLNIELQKYRGEDLKVVVQALLASLKDSVSLDRAHDAGKVLDIWRLFRPSPDMEKATGDIRNLIADYEKAKSEEEARAVPRTGEDLLGQLEAEGIAGSAVSANVGKGMSKVKALHDIKKEFGGKLERLKEKL